MKEMTYTVTDAEGIHARPAGLLVKKAGEYASNIKIISGDKSVDAKRIFGVMGLGVKQGNTVTVTAEGSDEDVAIVELQKFFEENL